MATRDLLEHTVAAPAGSPLRVDEEAGIIFGVRILGPSSPNTYGVPGVEATEYAESAHADARRLYENLTVRANHPPRTNLKGERDVHDVFGQVRVCTTAVTADGPVTTGDLHYLKSHPMAPRVIEDVKRGLGVFGLSHNATAGRERVDRHRRRLVIESLTTARSADLVDRPATNRNLWESREPDVDKPKITLRALLESQRKRFSAGRLLWADALLEDEGMGDAVEAPAAEGETDPDAALWAGFCSAIEAVLGQYADGDLDSAGALVKIKSLLKTHEALGAKDEPEAPEKEGEVETPKDKAESVDPAVELARLKRRDAVRDLCEGLEYVPTKASLAALCGLDSDADRKALIGDLKAAAAGKGPAAKPKPGSVAAGFKGRALSESKGDAGGASKPDAAARLSMLRGR